MRVISGKFKGHSLTAFKADHIRPTTDFVKETIFNMLASYIEDSVVLDLFSGTGSLGIEAISRGATHVHFVDDHVKSIQILKQNLEKLKISEGFKISKLDVLKFLKSPDLKAEIILIDPPFTEKMADQVMKALAENLPPELRFVCIESVKNEVIQDKYGKLSLYKRKDYKDKFLSVYKIEVD